jgi:hypothetical protein
VCFREIHTWCERSGEYSDAGPAETECRCEGTLTGSGAASDAENSQRAKLLTGKF